MEEEFIKNLEKYCVDVQSINKGERDAAEKAIVELIKLQTPYSMCFALLQRSKSNLAHFYTLILMRDSSIREWAALEASLKIAIVDGLFEYMMFMYSLEFVGQATKNQAFNTLGVIVKRAWMDEDKYSAAGGNTLNNIVMERVYKMFDSGHAGHLEIGIRLVQALVIEFSGSSKSCNIQLTWDYHQKCMLSFQTSHLQPLFRKLLSLLEQFKQLLTSNPALRDAKTLSTLNLTLNIFTSMLDWKFIDPNRPNYSFIFSTVQTPLKPTSDWAPLFVARPSPVLELVFGLYPLISHFEKIPSLLRSTMVQLCNLGDTVLDTVPTKTQYISDLIKYLHPLLETAIVTKNWTEMEDISNILYRFTYNFKFINIAHLPNQQVLPFYTNIARFIFNSMELMKISIDHGESDLEDEIEADCFDILLKAWVSLVSDADEKSQRKRSILPENFTTQFETLRDCTGQIFQQYIQTRLELSKKELSKFDTLEEENEISEDKKKYQEQLASIAYIGRFNPGPSMEILKNEIKRCVTSLKERMSDPVLFESLHWLIIFAGNLLFDPEEKTVSAIPTLIENYSFSQYNKDNNCTDSIVELSNAVFSFSMEYENPLLNHNNGVAHISPLVSQTSLWFAAGWSLVYLLPSSGLNPNLSPSLLKAYHQEDSVFGICDYFLYKVLLNLKTWQSDIDVLKNSCLLLNNLCQNRELAKFLIKSEHWSKLFYLQDGLSNLPANIQSLLFEAFTKVIFSFDNDNRQKYFIELTKSLMDQMDTILSRSDFKSVAQTPQVKETIYLFLEKLNGITKVSESMNHEEQTLYLAPKLILKYSNYFLGLIPIYDHYQDIINLILSLYYNLTKHQLEFLTENVANEIFPSIINIFREVATILSTSKKNAMEYKDYYNRVKKLVKILYNFTSFTDSQGNCTNLINQVIFHGLCIITPLLTNKDLLQYPKLSRQFFSIITFIFTSTFVEVKNLPVEISNILYTLIDGGINHHDMEIVKACFECISSLTDNLERIKKKQNTIDPHYQGVVIQFMGSVVNFLLLQDFNVDELLFPASNTLFALMLSNIDGYRTKVIDLITRQDSSIQNRVAQQFETLIISGTDRKAKDEFLKSLQLFLVNVKPLLKKK
ncbi:hypothetical protein CYY_005088 [Polysphondylium violaceum]|uniref:Exportin-4 n=1 Tax=Polysphondylium violaceum TaxID=133409 RepID=A0A8J4PX50_9MYCE|nr:hypothetical protein CYY_005088 [Polysphondylium violaceum]